MATKQGGERGPEVNSQMSLRNSKTFCQCSLNDLEKKLYVLLTSQNWYFRGEIFIKESIFQIITRKLGEYDSHGNILIRWNPLK